MTMSSAALARRVLFLRRRLEALGDRGRGFKYPAELRREVGLAIMEAVEGGESLSMVCSTLGLGTGTGRRWMESVDAPRGGSPVVELVPVRVRADPDDVGEAPLVEGPQGIEIITPGGYRVAGLSVSEAVTLLEQLG